MRIKRRDGKLQIVADKYVLIMDRRQMLARLYLAKGDLYYPKALG